MNKSICSNIKGKAVSLTILCVFSYTISFASVNVGVDRGKWDYSESESGNLQFKRKSN